MCQTNINYFQQDLPKILFFLFFLTRFGEHEFIGSYGGNRIPTHEKLVKTSTPPPLPSPPLPRLHSTLWSVCDTDRQTLVSSESVLTQKRKRDVAHREREMMWKHTDEEQVHTHTQREKEKEKEKESEKKIIHRLSERDGAVSVLCQRWDVVCH